MADPLSALGLAANIVQFVTFASDLITKTRKLSASTDGSLVQNAELEAITLSLRAFSYGFYDSMGGTSSSERELQALCHGCQNVTQELLGVIEGLKSLKLHTKWNSFRHALASMWEEGKIDALAQRLDRFRGQINTALLVCLRSNLAAVESTLKHQALYMRETQQWQMRFMETLLSPDSNLQKEQRLFVQLSSGSNDQRSNNLRRELIEMLKYSSMDERVDRVPVAYATTYEWIFDDIQPSSDSENFGTAEMQQNRPTLGNSKTLHTWSSYTQWLQSDGPLYWITGKPGSGKSTLMKYLGTNSQTYGHLKKWAKNRKLISAGFFFWNSGSQMEMSQIALFRNLLYQIIRQCNDLLPQLFPERWKYIQEFGRDICPWSLSELRRAFLTLLSSGDKCFFFFIDGVDEFGGDQSQLADFLVNAASSHPNVKMCVASRPWLVFEEAFQCPSLRLEDLTAPDIHCFVLGTLGSNHSFRQLRTIATEEAESLVLEVTEKAQGVFLWVSLVTDSLIKGLRDGDRILDLQERLSHLPSGLEDLFHKIMDGIEPKYRNEAAKYFQVVHTISTSSSLFPLSLLTFSFIEDGYDKAIASETKPMFQVERRYLGDTMRRRLNSRCKGLLEAPDHRSERENATVQYLHRTVKDFISSEKIVHTIQNWSSNDFDTNRAICAGYILHLKKIEIRRGMALDEFWASFTSCVTFSLSFQDSENELHLNVLDELEGIAKRFFENKKPKHQRLLEDTLKMESMRGLSLNTGPKVYDGFFLCFAVRNSLHSFVQHRLIAIRKENTSNISDEKLQIIGYKLLHEAVFKKDVQMVQLLLGQGIDPNFVNGSSVKYSVWKEIIHEIYWCVALPPIAILREFLQYGAEPEISVNHLSLDAILQKAYSRSKETDQNMLVELKALRKQKGSRWLVLKRKLRK